MTIDDFINQTEDVPNSDWAWWKASARNNGITVMDDDSGFLDNANVTREQAREALKKCTVQILSIDGQERINNWVTEYDKLIKNPPKPGDILIAPDGKRIKLDVVKELHKPPFISTRAYVPENIGSALGWFVTAEDESRSHGFRVIIGIKSRDAAIRKFGLSGNEMFVQELTVLRNSHDNNSLVAEISKW